MASLKTKILNHPAVQGLEKDDDEWGYWCYLKTNYIYPEMECALIHEQTFAKIIECLRSVKEKIPCYACQGGGCPVCSGFGYLLQS